MYKWETSTNSKQTSINKNGHPTIIDNIPQRPDIFERSLARLRTAHTSLTHTYLLFDSDPSVYNFYEETLTFPHILIFYEKYHNRQKQVALLHNILKIHILLNHCKLKYINITIFTYL